MSLQYINITSGTETYKSTYNKINNNLSEQFVSGSYSNELLNLYRFDGSIYTISGFTNNGSSGITGLTSSDITNALGYVPYNSTNPNSFINFISGDTRYYLNTNQNNYITSSFTENSYYKITNPSNYISGVTFNNITSALGYIPISSVTLVSYTSITITSNYPVPDFSAPEKAVNGTKKVYKIIGNNVNTITINPAWVNTNGTLPSIFSTNYVFAEVVDSKVLFYIIKENLATPSTPSLLGITTSFDGFTVYLTYDKLLAGTPVYTISGGYTVASYLITGNVLAITLTTPLISSASYTISGSGLTDTDLVPNPCPTLTAQAINNTTSPNLKSLSNNASAGITYTTAAKLQLATGAGGTDSPFTCDFWMYKTTAGSVIFFINHSTFQITTNATNRLEFGMINGASVISVATTATIPLNTWTRITCTYNGSKLVSGLLVYINGALAATTSFSSAYTGGATGGVLQLLSLTTNTSYVDEVAIFNIAMNSTQITSIYNNGVVQDIRATSFNSNLLFYGKYDNATTDLSASPASFASGTVVYQTTKP